jgi:vacuolar-type H+-ATPase subunit H
MPSRDILDKLFDVEKKAEEIAVSAKEEAGRRIARAKEESEAAFKAAYEAKVAELSVELEESRKRTDIEFRGELASFRSLLESADTDVPAFKKICDGFLFGRT